LNAQVLGISVDHIPGLQAWAESFGGISYPLLSDFWPHGKVAEKYGVLREDGRAERAIFILDEEGIIRYIDIHDIDEQPDNEDIFRVLRELTPQGSEDETPEREPLPTGGIIMYCTKWCRDCPRARQWLEANAIPFSEIDIYAVSGAWAQVRAWGGGRIITPTFDIDGEIYHDFNEETFAAFLRRKGYKTP